MIDRSWSLDVKPVYHRRDSFFDGSYYYRWDDVLDYIRVAVKSGNREVLTFHAVKPAPPSDDDAENYYMTLRRTEDPGDGNSLNLDPMAQLIADAELGRKVRKAGLEFK